MQAKVMIVFGTRPEIVKMYPLIEAFKQSQCELLTLTTAQHRDMMDMFCKTFEITPDIDLDLMQSRQTLGGLTARIMDAVMPVLEKERPDLVLVQGDTTTVMVTALAASYLKIPVGHVEAGLRTPDLYDPFPEEINRRLVGQMASLHFAPTSRAAQALAQENIPPSKIFCTGNTVIDAILKMSDKHPGYNFYQEHQLDETKKHIFVTAHRRENWGQPLENICQALLNIVNEHADIEIVFPVHKNPVVRETVFPRLDTHPQIHLMEPLDYLPLMDAMRRSHLVLTDSGGIQEEAPSLGKPLLVMRETTERPEGIEHGTARLVGTDTQSICKAVNQLLSDPDCYAAMSQAINPYGDGLASERILAIVENHLGFERPLLPAFLDTE